MRAHLRRTARPHPLRRLRRPRVARSPDSATPRRHCRERTSSTWASSPRAWSRSSPASCRSTPRRSAPPALRLDVGVGVPRVLRLVRGLGRPGRRGVVAASLFGISLPIAVHQAAVGAFGLSLLCLILALFVFPGGDCSSVSGLGGITATPATASATGSRCSRCWPASALSVMRMRESTTTTSPPDRSSTYDGRRPIRPAPVALLIFPGRPAWRDDLGGRPASYAVSNAKPSCHGESVAALVQRRWRPLCVPMK